MTIDSGGVAAGPSSDGRGPVVSSGLKRVLRALDAVRAAPDDHDAVHALGVALRRSRSIAGVMRELDPHPVWTRVERTPKRLFRALGALRDLRILEELIDARIAAGDPLRAVLLDALRLRAVTARADAARAAAAFDRRAWRQLASAVRDRPKIAPDGVVARAIALGRLVALRRLHARVIRAPAPAAWHQLRLGVKRFRYIVEACLPACSALMHDDLRRLQDLLGRLHDLDVLDVFAAELAVGAHTGAIVRLRAAADAERDVVSAEYRQLTCGRAGLLRRWQAELPHGRRMAASTAARLRALARACDPNLRRTLRVTRLARQILDTTDGRLSASDRRAEAMLRAASHVHGIRVSRTGAPRQKAAAKLLRSLPAPPGWTSADWHNVSWIVRYHRGAEPRAAHRRFTYLSSERQALVRTLAGVLRLARVLARLGATRVERADDRPSSHLHVRATGLPDGRKTAARLASAKHLLESGLGCHVIVDRV